MKRPNVIFILSDQHNAKVTGYNGHADVKTPNMVIEPVPLEKFIVRNIGWRTTVINSWKQEVAV